MSGTPADRGMGRCSEIDSLAVAAAGFSSVLSTPRCRTLDRVDFVVAVTVASATVGRGLTGPGSR